MADTGGDAYSVDPTDLDAEAMAMVATALTHARLNRTVLMGLAAAATALTCLFIFFVGALLHQDELRQLELHQDELLTPTFLRRHPKQHRLLLPRLSSLRRPQLW